MSADNLQTDSQTHPQIELTSLFADVQSLLLTVGRLEVFLEDVARLAAQVTPQTSCGITMRRDGEPVTIAATDERARTLDETQYAVGYGPCLHSLEVGQVVSPMRPPRPGGPNTSPLLAPGACGAPSACSSATTARRLGP